LIKLGIKKSDYLGFGSDYVPFFHHLGISSIDFSFIGDNYGTYHSIYDSIRYVSKIIDDGFAVCKSSSSIIGLVALRLSNDELLPFNIIEQTKVLRASFDNINSSQTFNNYVANLPINETELFNSSMNDVKKKVLKHYKIVQILFKKN